MQATSSRPCSTEIMADSKTFTTWLYAAIHLLQKYMKQWAKSGLKVA